MDYFVKIFDNYEFPFNAESLSGKTVFITGGTGFFGVWLLSLFQYFNQTHDVRVVVLSRNPASFLMKFPKFKNCEWLVWVMGNVVNFNHEKISCDYIIHGATDTSSAAHKRHSDMLNTILAGTHNVLKLAIKNKVNKILLISSGAVYGPQESLLSGQDETDPRACNPLQVSSTYGESKRCMELLGAISHFENDLNVSYARCFSFMGPGLPINGHFAFGNFIGDALSGKPLIITGDGEAIRSYLHAGELVIWLVNIMINGRNNEAYNLGSDKPISIKQLAARIQNLVSPSSSIIIKCERSPSPTDYRVYVPNIKKIRELGCKIQIDLDQGINDTFEYEQERRSLFNQRRQ